MITKAMGLSDWRQLLNDEAIIQEARGYTHEADGGSDMSSVPSEEVSAASAPAAISKLPSFITE